MPQTKPARSAKKPRTAEKAPPKRGDREWHKAFRGRLEDLLRAHGLSQAKFAKVCGLDPQRVSDWLNFRKVQLPSVSHLRAVGTALGVSLDWLLFGVGGEGPIYRDQARPPAELAQDVAVHVARELRVAGLMEAGPMEAGLSDEWIDGELLLENAVQTASAERRRFDFSRRQPGDPNRQALGMAVANLTLEIIPPAIRERCLEELDRHPAAEVLDALAWQRRYIGSPITRRLISEAIRRAQKRDSSARPVRLPITISDFNEPV